MFFIERTSRGREAPRWKSELGLRRLWAQGLGLGLFRAAGCALANSLFFLQAPLPAETHHSWIPGVASARVHLDACRHLRESTWRVSVRRVLES